MSVLVKYLERYRRVMFVGVVVAVITVVGALSIYRDGISRQTQIAYQKRDVTTVLGATTQSAGLSVSILNIQKVGTRNYLTISVKNDSMKHLEFSPGFQLYAISADNSELPISSLSEIDPLNGGPLEAGQAVSGTVVFVLDRQDVKFLRVYDDATKQTYKDTALTIVAD